MGTNTIITVSGANNASDLNQFKTAFTKDIVPRNIIGVPENLAGDLGQTLLRFKKLWVKEIDLDGTPLTPTGGVSVRNSIASGQERSTSSKSDFIRATGSSNTATIEGATTNLVVDINAVVVTVNSDINLTSLQTAPTTNNTCLVNDVNLGKIVNFNVNHPLTANEPMYLNEDIVGSTSGARGKVISKENDGPAQGTYYVKMITTAQFQNGETITGQTSSETNTINSVPSDTFILGSKYQGEDGTSIIVDNMGSEITSRIGQYVALKHGTSEIMFAYVKSSTELTNVYRGFFFDDSGDPIVREILSDNDTLTLYELGWVFLDADAVSYEVSYLTPIWSKNQPTGVVAGQYWYDLTNLIWKRYDGAIWVDQTKLPIGWVVINGTNCIASRSFDFSLNYNALNTIEHIEIESVTQIKTISHKHNLISVNANTIDFGYSKIIWDITSNLETGYTEASNTWYYLYLDKNGQVIISPERPYFRPDLQGYYHPYNSWRWVAEAFNDGSSNLTKTFVDLLNTKEFYDSNLISLFHRPILTKKLICELISGGSRTDAANVPTGGGSSLFLETNVGGGYYEDTGQIPSTDTAYADNFDTFLRPNSGVRDASGISNFYPYGIGADYNYDSNGSIDSLNGSYISKFLELEYFEIPFIVGKGADSFTGSGTGDDGRGILTYL